MKTTPRISAQLLHAVRLALLATATVWAVAVQAHRVEAQCLSVRPGDDVWLMSTRHLGCPSGEEPALCVRRYEDGWQEADTGAFLAAHDSWGVTCFYVHAARVDHGTAKSRGLQLYRLLAARSPIEQPLRLVIWSWPCVKSRRPLRDFRITAGQIDPQAFYLAQILSRMRPETRVSLVGFSYGGPMIAAAAHAVAGGSLSGYRLNDATGPVQVRAVFLSPAMHNYWLLPNSRYGLAMSRLDHLYLVINSSDPVLKRYRFIERRARPRALGYTGLACACQMGDALSRITQQDASRHIGRSHSFERHFEASCVRARAVACLLWEPMIDCYGGERRQAGEGVEGVQSEKCKVQSAK
jgi:hypothetical protein